MRHLNNFEGSVICSFLFVQDKERHACSIPRICYCSMLPDRHVTGHARHKAGKDDVGGLGQVEGDFVLKPFPRAI